MSQIIVFLDYSVFVIIGSQNHNHDYISINCTALLPALMTACLSACMSACLHACLLACMPACLSVCLSLLTCLSVFQIQTIKQSNSSLKEKIISGVDEFRQPEVTVATQTVAPC